MVGKEIDEQKEPLLGDQLALDHGMRFRSVSFMSSLAGGYKDETEKSSPFQVLLLYSRDKVPKVPKVSKVTDVRDVQCVRSNTLDTLD